MLPGRRNLFVFLCLGVILSFLIAGSAFAHAVLLESHPALNSTVIGPNLPLMLRFNVRIDVVRSRLTLIRPDGSSQTLELDRHGPADTISSQAKGLLPGAYRLRWQVLASDGHITRGEIPFTVANS
jgi:copper resistance protein C